MSLPHSNAASERVFSELNLIKTKTRNRLLHATCNSLLMAKQLMFDVPCYGWTPPNRLANINVKY